MTTPERKAACVILSHGRANNVKTYETLYQQNWTGPIYVVIDNEDPQADEYHARYGDRVIVFDKKAEQARTDQMDNFPKRNTVTYARNASQRILREMGYTHILQLDDDYQYFSHRVVQRAGLRGYRAPNLDQIFNLFWDFLDTTPTKVVTLAQGGDYIGGWRTTLYWHTYRRKAMNSFFIRLDNPVEFIGRMNDDVNTYVRGGNHGDVYLTHTLINLAQEQTQANAGGLTDMYLDAGTYVKSMYTVMLQPSSVEVTTLDGGDAARMHHSIQWDRTVPKILPPTARNPH